jgi:hypothetical protein
MNTDNLIQNLYPFDRGYQDRLLECLANIPDYPFSEKIDRTLAAELMRDFPDIDLVEQLKAWRWYRIDNPTKLKNPRSALRRWMMKARDFGL